MPFYEYRCNECGHRFEMLQRMADEPVSTCEQCGADAAQRILFAPAIHFKGSGFHNTDYGTKRRPVGGDAATAESSGNGDTASVGASSGDSSPPASSGKTVGLDSV